MEASLYRQNLNHNVSLIGMKIWVLRMRMALWQIKKKRSVSLVDEGEVDILEEVKKAWEMGKMLGFSVDIDAIWALAKIEEIKQERKTMLKEGIKEERRENPSSKRHAKLGVFSALMWGAYGVDLLFLLFGGVLFFT